MDVNVIIVSTMDVITMNSSMPDEYCSAQREESRRDEVVVAKERKRVREAVRYCTVNVFINCVSVHILLCLIVGSICCFINMKWSQCTQRMSQEAKDDNSCCPVRGSICQRDC